MSFLAAPMIVHFFYLELINLINNGKRVKKAIAYVWEIFFPFSWYIFPFMAREKR